MTHDADPDIFWFLGFFPYWIGGTLLLWLPLSGDGPADEHGLILAAIVAATGYLLVLGFWLIRAFRRRRTYRDALRAHERAVEAERQREAQRAKLRASRPFPG